MNRRDAVAILFLIAFPFIYFFPVTLGKSVWNTRDISRVYHPFAVELSRALSEGRLPLWTPYLQTGFPLLAEGQIAAFYLPQLLLVKLLPAQYVVSYEMLIHLAFAAVGMYYCARIFDSSAPSALMAGFAFSFSGFMIQKLYHTPILMTAAWLPWLIFLFERWQRARRDHDKRRGVWLLLTTLAIAMQWLAGSVQIAFLNSIILAVFGFVGRVFWDRVDGSAQLSFARIRRAFITTALPLVLGTSLAAIQLVPTTELLGYSTRAHGLDEKLQTLYSYSSDSLAQFIFPFSQGEPSDDNVELWGYCGISILLLAISALRDRRDARTIFLLAFALTALSLTLGASNPLFQLLSRLPVFGSFRVPARYVFPFAFAMVLLAARGFDGPAKNLPNFSKSLSAGLAGLCLAIVFVELNVIRFAYTESFGFWLGTWNILPWVIGSLSVILILLGWMNRINQRLFRTAMFGLVLFDLSSYAAPFLSTTVAQLTFPPNITQAPRSVQALGTPRALERILTDETIWPSVPALRASLYPNFGLLFGYEMVHAYTPLIFDANETYFYNLSPAMLNLVNARYFSVPLEPRITDRTPTPFAELTLDVVDNETAILPTPAISIQVDSFTEGAAAMPTGSPAAELIVKLEDGARQQFPLRIGIETADWDLGKGSVSSQAHIAHKVSAFVRALGRPFDGAVYRGELALGALPRKIVSVNVHPLVPKAQITIERIALVDEKGNAISLAGLTNKNEFRLFFMSDTAAIWENLDVLPRAFLVHRAEVIKRDAVFARLHQPDFDGGELVLLSDGQAISGTNVNRASEHAEITRYEPERVDLAVRAEEPGYVVLADSWYPGWNAYVDGQAQTIYRADFLFRTVKVEPGEHAVVFEFRPMSVYVGAGISIASFLIVVGIAIVLHRVPG